MNASRRYPVRSYLGGVIVTILGSGSALPTARRSSAGYLVECNGRSLVAAVVSLVWLGLLAQFVRPI